MKALELYSIWADNGVPDAILKKQLLTINIFGPPQQNLWVDSGSGRRPNV